MLKHRKLLISAALAILILAALAFFYFFRNAHPPEAALLLPEGDLLLYADLKPIHLVDLNKSAPVQVEGDYQRFISQTGIEVERDLDQVAVSRRDNPDHSDVESSEVLIGKFDSSRLSAYLQNIASSTEQYRERNIYEISHEGHTVRVSLLDARRVAITNMPSPEPMHGIIDRTYSASSGPSLLAAQYQHVPAASVAWLICRLPNRQDNVQLPGGLAFTLPGDTVAVASLRYLGSLLLRADVYAQSESEARQIVDAANRHLALVKSIGQWVGARGSNKEVKSAFESIQVEQKENVAVFTATVSPSVLKKLWSEADAEGIAPAAPQKR